MRTEREEKAEQMAMDDWADLGLEMRIINAYVELSDFVVYLEDQIEAFELAQAKCPDLVSLGESLAKYRRCLRIVTEWIDGLPASQAWISDRAKFHMEQTAEEVGE